MAAEILHHALNVGVVDEDNLHRIDLAKMRLAAEDQTNIMPLATGPAFFRAGFQYIATVKGSNHCRPISFVAGNSAAYVLELTSGTLRVLNCATDTYITRAAVSSTVTNGDFSSSAGWALATSAGQTTTITGGKLEMTARAHGGRASASRLFTVVETGTIHALRVVVDRGPVIFRLGTTLGNDDLISEAVLDTGIHSLAFTPNGANAHIFMFSDLSYKVIVDQVQVESAGAMELTTPWSDDENWALEKTQSLDVMYLGVNTNQQKTVERRGNGTSAGLSWSIVDYKTDDGPFFPLRSSPVTITPSACEGDISLTASSAFFKPEHVGALFKVWHSDQRIDTYLAGLNQFTKTIMITGITETNFEERKYAYSVSGTWIGTIRNYRSFDGEDIEFHPVRREQSSATIDITANATFTNDDNDDNAITWLKIGFYAYTSGEARIVITYEGGGGFGIARVTGYTSSTVVSAQVLTPFLGITPSDDWQEGMWSDYRGWPTGVGFASGRLFWVGSDNIWGSVSDAFKSFDEEFTGDAGPISRAIAIGGRNEARWILPLGQLMVGCDSRVAAVRASSLDEVITPTNFDVKNVDSVPAAPISAAELKNDRGLFVSDSRTSLYELSYSNDSGRYQATQFSLLNSNLFASGITQLTTQSLPNQRLWISVEDDDAAMVLYEPLLDIVAAIPIATAEGDVIEATCSVPGLFQDRLYAVIRRTVGGNTVRYMEKLALDSEAKPATITKCMDAFVTGGASASGVITGLTHLEGRTVVAWADGIPIDTLAVSPTTLLTTAAHETDNTLWSHGATTPGGSVLDPNGGTDADMVRETAANASHDTGVAGVTFAPGKHRATMTVQSVGGRDVQLGVFDNGFGSAVLYKVTAAGVISDNGSYGTAFTVNSASVEDLGNSWYTVTVDFTANVAVVSGWVFLNTFNGGSTFVGDPTKGFNFFEVTVRRRTNTSGTTKTFVVTGGQITLDNPVATGYCVGLPYRGRYKSARLAYGPEGSSPFMKNKTLSKVGVITSNHVRSGIQFGGFFDDADHPLRSLPDLDVTTGQEATDVVIGVSDDEQMNAVEGDLSFDPRLCIEFNSPKPCTIRAVVMEVG